MKKLIARLPAALLFGALAIVGNAAFAGEVHAVVCEGEGHSCHVIDGSGTTFHFQELEI